ncbi:MAG TPA: hypothetical protein VK707_03840 [Solirubrobacteraceae bacterium]|jgi:hypothetical protein|nr:hypothetical protein [Solirubrobacteraceae bacterium]
MRSSCSETLAVRLTPYERRLIEELAELRRITASDFLRELMGMEREDELRRTLRHLRPVSA